MKGRTLKDLLRDVARSCEPITVELEEGESVTIEPNSQLKPLPVMEGRVTEGWKDAIY